MRVPVWAERCRRKTTYNTLLSLDPYSCSHREANNLHTQRVFRGSCNHDTECGTQTQIVSRLQTGARAVPTLRVKVDRYYPRNQLLNETLAHRTAKASPRSPHHAPCTKICGEQWLSGFWNPSPTHEQPQVAPHPTSSCAAKNEPAYIRSKESVYLPARNAPRTEEHTGRHTPDPSAVLIKRHPDCSGYPQRHSSSREENRSGRCSVAPERRAAHWPLLDQLEKAAV